MSRGLPICLALLRIACGLSLIGPGVQKIGWFKAPHLEQQLAAFASHAPNALVLKYLHAVTPHHALLARIVVLGELGLGALLLAGFLTPFAAALAFVMVLNFHFASGALFRSDYFLGQSGLVYLLVFPLLFAGRAGTAFGVDGAVGRSLGRPPPRS